MSLFILFWVLCVMLLLSAGDIEENPGPINRKDGICRSLSMCHVNIRSLSLSKLLAVQTSLADLYDIITISESHLHQGIGNDVFTIPGFYEILRKDRDGNGGVEWRCISEIILLTKDIMSLNLPWLRLSGFLSRQFRERSYCVVAIDLQIGLTFGMILMLS